MLAIARAGAAQGCKEALFTLGDRPEERWPAARAVAGRARLRLHPGLPAGLRDRGAGGDRAAAAPQPGRAVLVGAAAAQAGRAEHGHDAGDHRDPAVVRAGRPALRLAGQGAGGPAAGARGRRPGRRAVHHRHPDRHRRDARPSGPRRSSRSAGSHREYGHIQEVIVQNFRAKPDTAMRGMPDAELRRPGRHGGGGPARARPEGPDPGPAEPASHGEYDLLLRAGIDDWGGVSPVTPDHVNPERPWPQIDELARHTPSGRLHAARAADDLPGVRAAPASPWLDPRLAPHVRALADPATGLAVEAAPPAGRPWQEPDEAFGGGRTDLHATIDTDGPHRRPAGRLRQRLRRLGRGRRARSSRAPADGTARPTMTCGPGCGWPPTTRPRCWSRGTRPRRWRCSTRTGRRWTSCAGSPTTCAGTRSATTSPTWSTATSTSPTSATSGCRFCAFAQRERDADAYRLSVDQVADRAEEAWRGRRHRGLHAGRHRPEAAGHRVRRPGPGGQGSGCRACTCTRSRRWRSSPPRPRPACPSGTG